MASQARREIRLIEEESGQWSAIDVEAGVASCGETREEALEMLDEAVALHKGEIDRPVTDEDLEEWGIDPDAVPEEPQVPDGRGRGRVASDAVRPRGARGFGPRFELVRDVAPGTKPRDYLRGAGSPGR